MYSHGPAHSQSTASYVLELCENSTKTSFFPLRKAVASPLLRLIKPIHCTDLAETVHRFCQTALGLMQLSELAQNNITWWSVKEGRKGCAAGAGPAPVSSGELLCWLSLRLTYYLNSVTLHATAGTWQLVNKQVKLGRFENQVLSRNCIWQGRRAN